MNIIMNIISVRPFSHTHIPWDNPNTLVALGLRPFNRVGFYHAYMLYCLYHHSTNNLRRIIFDCNSGMCRVCFSQAEAGQ